MTSPRPPEARGIASHQSPAITPAAARVVPNTAKPSGSVGAGGTIASRRATTAGAPCSRATRAAIAASISRSSARRSASASPATSAISVGPVRSIGVSCDGRSAASRRSARTRSRGLRIHARSASIEKVAIPIARIAAMPSAMPRSRVIPRRSLNPWARALSMARATPSVATSSSSKRA